MTKVSMSTKLGASTDQVWQMIGGFNTLPDWHPAIEKSELTDEGQERRLSLAGGGTIIERLEHVDEKERLYSYTIESGPLPVANYRATIRVQDEGNGTCSVDWSSEFDADGASESDAQAAIQGVYQAGLDNLKKMFGG